MTTDSRDWTGRTMTKAPAPRGADLGASSLDFLHHLGAVTLLALRCATALRRRPFELRELVRQIELLGVHSLGLAIVTSWLIGMVMGTQFAFGLSRRENEGSNVWRINSQTIFKSRSNRKGR